MSLAALPAAAIGILPAQSGTAGHDHELAAVDAAGVEAPADWASLRSGENYTGYQRIGNFASPGGAIPGQRHTYEIPGPLSLNHQALTGDRTIEERAVTLNGAGGQVAYRFHARDLHLVMGPSTPDVPVRFRVRIDGQPPAAAHGSDIDDEGNGTLEDADERVDQLV